MKYIVIITVSVLKGVLCMKRRNVDMVGGPIIRGLLTMTIPIMIMNIMSSIFNIIDMTALRHFSTDMAVGAVGACGSLITMCTSLIVGLSPGANIVVARYIGAGDRESTDRAATTALAVSVLGGLLMLIVGVSGAELFLKLTNCPKELLSQAVIYFKIYFLVYPFLMIYTFCAAILRSTGDTTRPMYFIILGGIVKVVFSITFLTIFDKDVECVAFATGISWAVMCVLSVIAVLKNEKLNIDLKKIRIYLKELREILFVGIPSGIQTGLYSFANVIIMTVVNSFGPNATTGISIANQFDGILYQIAYSPSLAAIPFVAQNVGAKNFKRVKKVVLRAVLVTSGFGLVFGMLSAVFSKELSSIMSTTPEVIMYSRQKMMLISSTYFICGINEIVGVSLKGMGRPIIPTIATMVYMCAFRFLWVYVIYPLCPQNLTFLYLVWPIGWILSISTQLCFYFPTLKKLKQKYA